MDFKMLINWLINQSETELLELLVNFKDNCLTLLAKAPAHINSFLAMPCTEDMVKKKVVPLIKNMIAQGIDVDLQRLATISKGASIKSILIFLIDIIATNFSIDASAPESVKLEMVDKFKLILGGLV